MQSRAVGRDAASRCTMRATSAASCGGARWHHAAGSSPACFAAAILSKASSDLASSSTAPTVAVSLLVSSRHASQMAYNVRPAEKTSTGSASAPADGRMSGAGWLHARGAWHAACGMRRGAVLTALGRSQLGCGEWRAERRVVERWTSVLLEPAQLLAIRQLRRHAKVTKLQLPQPVGASAHEDIPRAQIAMYHALIVDGLQRVEEAARPRVALCCGWWRLEERLPQLLVDPVEQDAKLGLATTTPLDPRVPVSHDRVALEQTVQLGLELGLFELVFGRHGHPLDRILPIIDGRGKLVDLARGARAQERVALEREREVHGWRCHPRPTGLVCNNRT